MRKLLIYKENDPASDAIIDRSKELEIGEMTSSIPPYLKHVISEIPCVVIESATKRRKILKILTHEKITKEEIDTVIDYDEIPTDCINRKMCLVSPSGIEFELNVDDNGVLKTKERVKKES